MNRPAPVPSRRTRPYPGRLLPLILFAAAPLAAQELTFLGRGVFATDRERSGTASHADCRQTIHRNFAALIAYINEGRLLAHHRDGNAWQARARLPLFEDRISLSLGLGACCFFDTRPRPGGDTANVHGTAPSYGLSGTGYLSNRWFYHVLVNRIEPARSIGTTMVAAGVGFWFGREQKPTPGKLGDAPGGYGYVTENEVTLHAGQSVVNTFFGQSSRAYAAEYRRGLRPHLDGTVSALHEGDPEIIRRNGLATRLWPVDTFFDERVAFGAGPGSYLYLDRKHPAGIGAENPAALAPLAPLAVSARLSARWIVRAVFHRVMSDYNRDADIFLLGPGRRRAP